MPQQLPTEFIDSLRDVAGFDEKAFLQTHLAGNPPVSIRLNTRKQWSTKYLYENYTKVPWCEDGAYLPHRPSFILDPLIHAGAYYVQEASSMFLHHVLKSCVPLQQDLVVLDLCAAPGGKSTLIQSLLTPGSVLISNEIIKSRAGILEENLVKWGATNTLITNNTPDAFSNLSQVFDLIVVDAPCSGSGMFRKDEKAIDEWSTQLVNMCNIRQKDILKKTLPALKPGGILVYSTCSYSAEENENILQWCLNDGLESVSVPLKEEWNIITSEVEGGGMGYRFYPDKLAGEGLFLTVLKKPEGDQHKIKIPAPRFSYLNKHDLAQAATWVKLHYDEQMIQWEGSCLILPEMMVKLLPLFQQHLYIKRAGLEVGSITKKDFIPTHALALSGRTNESIPVWDVDEEVALAFLRRDEMKDYTQAIGWTKINFQNLGLGWVKILSNRINNYYPINWRILKR